MFDYTGENLSRLMAGMGLSIHQAAEKTGLSAVRLSDQPDRRRGD